jgi:hypothetical protein
MAWQWVGVLGVSVFCVWLLWKLFKPEPTRFVVRLQCKICKGIESSGEVTVEEYKLFLDGWQERHTRCVQERTGP